MGGEQHLPKFGCEIDGRYADVRVLPRRLEWQTAKVSATARFAFGVLGGVLVPTTGGELVTFPLEPASVVETAKARGLSSFIHASTAGRALTAHRDRGCGSGSGSRLSRGRARQAVVC